MSLVIDGLTEKEGLKVYRTLRKQFGADDPVTLYAEKHFVAPFIEAKEEAGKCAECGRSGLTLDSGGMCHECWQEEQDKIIDEEGR